MTNTRYTALGCTLHWQPLPGQREIRRRPSRDFTLRRPMTAAPISSPEEAKPLV